MNKYDQRMKQLMDFGDHIIIQELRSVTEEELDAVEQEVGYFLPEDYREFLKDYGGFSVGTGVNFPDRNISSPAYGGCDGFYGVNPLNPFIDLVKCYRNRGEGWPLELLPISEADNGLMCLMISGCEKGAVYFWHWGQGGGEPIPEHIHYVASSFDEFMHLLHPMPEEDKKS